jgi:hypothetical protein
MRISDALLARPPRSSFRHARHCRLRLVPALAARELPRRWRLQVGPPRGDAEAYCRNFGAPLRYLDPKGVREPVGEVTYRCD